ncbi:hypothetical protein LCGC14_0244790 [marine sediment metagenome]|uniref:Uncharacterized protein n=1 Tax=marine sediment metagenome TaxID=412755 RepID=A0A0F9UN03_9ZZZZ
MSEYTRFSNLAGSEASDEVCTRELERAGIEVVKLPEICRYGEPKTVVMGQLGPWGFRRTWYYWVAEGPGIPPVEAEALHEEHGKVVRVDGHCGAPSPLEWFKGFAVGHYHVDAQEGLTALAETINTLRRDR